MVKRTNYEAPHYAFLSSFLLLLPFRSNNSYIQLNSVDSFSIEIFDTVF
jgi:hypothetical protein